MARTTEITTESLLARIDDELRQLRAQREKIERELQEIADASGSTRGRGDKDEKAKDENILAEIARDEAYLNQIREIIAVWPGAPRIMGAEVAKKLRGDARRSRALAFLQNLAFLAAGWLLSFVAPPTNFFH
jgi:hypothetical protein